MNISLFDVIGPVMVGPSSSHTAGAARLARTAALVVGKPLRHVDFFLHGSFALTGRGHGTHKALVAGVLGLAPDDERLSGSFSLAEKAGLGYRFFEKELEGVHDNSVEMHFVAQDGSEETILGSSIGGGRIVIRRIGGFETEFNAENSTLVIRQQDKKGLVSEISGRIAAYGLNIAVMRLSRDARGGNACCIIETDDVIPPGLLQDVLAVQGVEMARAINPKEAKDVP